MPLSSSILSRLKYQHETIHELIRGFSEEQLQQKVNPDKWSAFQNIVHLVAYQPQFIHRLKRMEQEDKPMFERYIADNDPLFHECSRRPLQTLLDDYSANRFLLNNQLSHLSETTLRREGVHPLYGNFTIAQWADFFLLHEAHHLFTIFMITAALRSHRQ